MRSRSLAPRLLEALADSPVVLLTGARQTGKSTLVQHLAATEHPARYLTLDDPTVLAAAQSDPAGFVAGLEGNVVLDEIQHAPELLPAIKLSVDRDRRPGRFLLTGSAKVLLLPRVAESLVGRMENLTLWPFSQSEIEGAPGNFVEEFLAREWSPSACPPESRRSLLQRVVRGGYPEVLTRAAAHRRQAWFASYVTTILQRDVRDLANIEGLTAMPRLLALFAARATGLLNYAEVSRSIGLPQSTLKRYMALLETTFLLQLQPPWSGSLGRRLVKSPKVLLSDTGLMAYLLGLEGEEMTEDSALVGPLLENFVAMELLKQSSFTRSRPQLLHFRMQTGREVDVVLEDRAGNVAGIEVKASASVSARDFDGLRALEEQSGKRFRRGAVLYSGSEAISFGPRLHALPTSVLWGK